MNNKNLAPIIVFTYNRPSYTVETIEHLKNNFLASSSDLFIYSDAPKNPIDAERVQDVRSYIKTINGFKSVTIIEREENLGLRNSVLDGVTRIVKKYGKVIVLEDDLITGPYFLDFINDGLDMYKNDINVCQIMGYSFVEKYKEKYKLNDTYFVKNISSLGWGVWDRSWRIYEHDTELLLQELMNKDIVLELNRGGAYDYFKILKDQINGNVDSWGINWLISTFLNNMHTLYPLRSLVRHIGNDSSSTHYQMDSMYDPLNVPITNKKIVINRQEVVELKNTTRAYNKYLKSYRLPTVVRIVNRITRHLGKFNFLKK
jgi:hypothetical protein